jgi:hypothetical protein
MAGIRLPSSDFLCQVISSGYAFSPSSLPQLYIVVVFQFTLNQDSGLAASIKKRWLL